MCPFVHYTSLETWETPLNTVSMDKDMSLDNKTIAVEQEEKKNKWLALWIVCWCNSLSG
jgi:hypothetical protein